MRELLNRCSRYADTALTWTIPAQRQQAARLLPCKAVRFPKSRATLRNFSYVAYQIGAARLVSVKSAFESAGNSVDLEVLVSSKLGLGSIATQQLLYHECETQHSHLEGVNTTDVQAGLDKLLLLFSSTEVVHLLKQQPALLVAPLTAWLDFFTEFGFSSSQIKNLISQTPEVLVNGSLAVAGDAILHLKHLGFDNDEVRHRVVAYCPQVLMMNAADINTLISLWSKFQVGVDERTGM